MTNWKATLVALVLTAAMGGSAYAAGLLFSFQDGDGNSYSGTEDTKVRYGEGADPGHLGVYEINYGIFGGPVLGGSGGRRGRVLMRFNDVFGNGANQVPLGSDIVSAELTISVFPDNPTEGLVAPMITNLPSYGNLPEQIATGGEPTGRYSAQFGSGNGTDWALPCISGAQCGPIDRAISPTAFDWDSTHAAAVTNNGGSTSGPWVFDVTELVRQGFLAGDPANGTQGAGILLKEVQDIFTPMAAAEHGDQQSRPLLTITIPEPTTVALLSLGGLLVVRRGRRAA